MALFLLLTMVACTPRTPLASASSEADSCAIAKANQATIAMMQQVCSLDSDNVWLSPLCAQMALSTAYDGAKGTTADEMLPLVSHLSLANNEQLQVASALWISPSFPVEKDYRKLCKQRGAEIYNERIRAEKVNQWAAKHTNGKINQVLNEPLPADLAMLIANAVYFSADWEHPFGAEKTHPEPFYLSNGDVQEATMMAQTSRFSYTNAEDCEMLTLPYQPTKSGEKYQMHILLPHTDISADVLLQKLSADRLCAMRDAATECKVEVTLPKLELDYSRLLNRDLYDLGMRAAFTSGQVDFSGISREPLVIGVVKQDSYLRMDEKGTEAAAVTVVQLSRMSMPIREEIVEFHVNRPYLLVLEQTENNLILFMGKVEKMTK